MSTLGGGGCEGAAGYGSIAFITWVQLNFWIEIDLSPPTS